jgi:hypothetical protein
MPAVNTMFGGSIQATAPMSGYQQTPTTAPLAVGGGAGGSAVIDGTPTRVATIAGVMVLGLCGLKYLGIKFNVAAGN